jgi:hypothetical protein
MQSKIVADVLNKFPQVNGRRKKKQKDETVENYTFEKTTTQVQ